MAAPRILGSTARATAAAVLPCDDDMRGLVVAVGEQADITDDVAAGMHPGCVVRVGVGLMTGEFVRLIDGALVSGPDWPGARA